MYDLFVMILHSGWTFSVNLSTVLHLSVFSTRRESFNSPLMSVFLSLPSPAFEQALHSEWLMEIFHLFSGSPPLFSLFSHIKSKDLAQDRQAQAISHHPVIPSREKNTYGREGTDLFFSGGGSAHAGNALLLVPSFYYF